MNKTNIEYMDYSWNPIIMRCTPVSEGCEHCWHIGMCDRMKHIGPDKWIHTIYAGKNKPYLDPSRLNDPLKRKKPSIIGVQFMGDLFHPDCFQNYIINDIYLTMAQAKQHTFLILTKRPDNMLEWFNKYTREVDSPPPNIWLGITAENQQRLDERWPILEQIPAAKRFVSVEPMLEKLSLRHPAARGRSFREWDWIHKIYWVIAGCESGPNRRPAKIEWFRDLKTQCVEAGIPFFLKQAGGYIGGKPTVVKMPWLDGREWNERP